MKTEALSALIIYSPEPARLAAFYREHLGIPFAESDHEGQWGKHQEALFGGVHFAIWGAKEKRGSAIVATYRVANLDAAIAELASQGVASKHPPIDIGEGKRVVSFEDPDGNLFRFIQLTPAEARLAAQQ
jgi:predicted enzyme related to lactoylglutathione lyase